MTAVRSFARLTSSFWYVHLLKNNRLKRKEKQMTFLFTTTDLSIRLVMAGSKMCASSFNIHQVIENLEIKKKMTGKEIVKRVLKLTSAHPVLSGPPPC